MNDSPRTNLCRLLAVVSVALSLVCVQPSVGLAAGHSKGLAWYRVLSGEIEIWQISNGSGSVTGKQTVSERCDQACVNEFNVVGMGDLNRDGVTDITWHNFVTGEVRTWLLNGAGTVIGTQRLNWRCDAVCYERWKPIGIGDMNHDGFADLWWYDRTDGIVSAWLLTGTTTVAGRMDLDWRCDGASSCAFRWEPIAIGDLNHDGFDDLVWHEVMSGTVSAWILNGSPWVAGTRELDWRCAEECSAEWYPIAMGDFNGDGAQDLWWHNHRTGLVAAWLLNGGTIVAGSGLLTELCGVSDGCVLQVPIGISH